jgi:hypothetical protein
MRGGEVARWFRNPAWLIRQSENEIQQSKIRQLFAATAQRLSTDTISRIRAADRKNSMLAYAVLCIRELVTNYLIYL